MSRSKWSKCNQSIINSVRAFSQAENLLRYLIEVGVNEGLHWGTVWVQNEATSWPRPRGCMCGGACVWERKGGRGFFRPCMFVFHISCWNCRTTQWGSDPWVMCVVSPPIQFKRITKTNAKNDIVWYIQALQLCYLIPDNISHILRFSVVMTDISVLRRNQFGSLNRWERGKNRRKLH